MPAWGKSRPQIAGRLALCIGALYTAMGDRYCPPPDTFAGAPERELIVKFPLIRCKARPVMPPAGYDLWAATYDVQPQNAVLALESRLFSELLMRIPLEAKAVLDVGCGTGSIGQRSFHALRVEVIGVDPSQGMLQRLKSRHRGTPSLLPSWRSARICLPILAM